jgi:hypothetical protein
MRCCGRRFWLAGLAAVLTIGMVAPLVVQAEVNEVKWSLTPSGGKAFWVPVHLYSARSANYVAGQSDFIENILAPGKPPLCGHSYYFPLTDPPDGTMSVDAWRVSCASPCVAQADAWVEYQLLPSQLPTGWDAFMDGVAAHSTWFFHSRAQQPDETTDTNYNKDSDWLIANGHPVGGNGADDHGDLDKSNPTDADWFAAATDDSVNTGTQSKYDRCANDTYQGGGQPRLTGSGWCWRGVNTVGGTRTRKIVKLIDGKFTYRIYEAEAETWNSRIDIMCWTTDENYWPSDADYDAAHFLNDCLPAQHDVSNFTPTTQNNDTNTTLTLTGTRLDLVTGVQLIRLSGAPGAGDIVGSISSQTTDTLVAEFTTAGAGWGSFRLRTLQNSPCSNVNLATPTFVLNCASATVFTAVEPNEVLNPTAGLLQTLRIKGTNVTALAGTGCTMTLEYMNRWANPVLNIPAQNIRVAGDDLLAEFDIATCARDGGAPAGPYRLVGTRVPTDCSNPATLQQAFWVRKDPPLGACNWQPWAAAWSNVNKGGVKSAVGSGQTCANSGDCNNYDPTNWDYTFSQDTAMGTPKDVPPGGGLKAMHFFWDGPSGGTSTKAGSGGIYEQINVTPGVPIEYSFYWKAAATPGTNQNVWLELILLDGPWNLYYADGFQEAADKEGRYNPYIVRKTTMPTGGTIPWTQVTDQTPADSGNYGLRPTTITPTHDIVTVVMKCGREQQGGLEVFFDNIDVHQAGGPNLVVNGGFENALQFDPCNNELLYQDKCEQDFWRRSLDTPPPTCSADPFADVDRDGDVDQTDFAYFQACYSGPDNRPAEECACLDYNDPVTGKNDRIDQADLLAFENCASGPGIPADVACDNPTPP